MSYNDTDSRIKDSYQYLVNVYAAGETSTLVDWCGFDELHDAEEHANCLCDQFSGIDDDWTRITVVDTHSIFSHLVDHELLVLWAPPQVRHAVLTSYGEGRTRPNLLVCSSDKEARIVYMDRMGICNAAIESGQSWQLSVLHLGRPVLTASCRKPLSARLRKAE